MTFSLLAPKPCAPAGATAISPQLIENSRTIFAERLIFSPVDLPFVDLPFVDALVASSGLVKQNPDPHRQPLAYRLPATSSLHYLLLLPELEPLFLEPEDEQDDDDPVELHGVGLLKFVSEGCTLMCIEA